MQQAFAWTQRTRVCRLHVPLRQPAKVSTAFAVDATQRAVRAAENALQKPVWDKCQCVVNFSVVESTDFDRLLALCLEVENVRDVVCLETSGTACPSRAAMCTGALPFDCRPHAPLFVRVCWNPQINSATEPLAIHANRTLAS